MRIPTLIGVALIITLLVSGGLFVYRQKIKPVKIPVINDLQVVNASHDSAAVIWQTEVPTVGRVAFGSSAKNLNQKADDIRDQIVSQPRITHFVTLKKLQPDSKYFYQITGDGYAYPEKPEEFNAANVLPETEEISFSFMKPLKGTVLNTNLNPIDEALIFLKIPGAQNLATFSSTAGNFILPLKSVLSEDLKQLLPIPQNTPAILTLLKGNLKSEIKILISDSTVNLPPVAIGNNLDLTNFIPVPITTISIGQSAKIRLDFNNDGKINSLDLAILRGKANSKEVLSLQELAGYDVNQDGIIDQKDIDVFSKALAGI